MKVDRRTERGFPALLPDRINALARHYNISMGETRRIAGYDCQAVVLTPKDEGMKGAIFLADRDSGSVVVISLWAGPEELQASEGEATRVREEVTLPGETA